MSATEQQTPTAADQPHKISYELGVSSYDRVSSLLLSLVVLIGAVVLALVVVVFSGRWFAPPRSVPVELERVATTSQPSLGLARDPDPLGAEDAPDADRPELRDTLAQISDTAAEMLAPLDAQANSSDPRSTQGLGQGDARAAGHGSDGIVERVPRAQRWEVRFESTSLKSYARQLDFFGIELAALAGDQQVHYAANFAAGAPRKRISTPEREERLYMTWRAGRQQAADRALLSQAGVSHQGRIVLQFYPGEVEAQLAKLELRHAAGRDVNEIRKTVFNVRPEGDAFSFQVIDQRYFD